MSLDISIVILIWQIIVFTLVGFVYLVDFYRQRDRIRIFQNWPKFLIDYSCGLILFFFILGVIGIFAAFLKFLMFCLGGNTHVEPYSAYNYPYHYNYRYDWFFIWYWYAIWAPYPSPYGPYCCYCDLPVNCNAQLCSGNCDIGRGNDTFGGIIAIILIVIFIIIVLIGLLVGVLLLLKILYDIAQRRWVILERKGLLTEKIVMDLEGTN